MMLKRNDWIALFGLVIGLVCIAGVLVYVVSLFSTYELYGGEENQANNELAPSLCGDDPLIQVHGCCGHIQVRCQRFKWPIHCYSQIGATQNYNYCRGWLKGE